MTGLSLDPAGDHFVLRSVKPDGTSTTMPLSVDDVVTLVAIAPALSQQVFARLHPEGGEKPGAIIAANVAQVKFHPERLGEMLLMSLLFDTSGNCQATFAFPLDLAAQMAEDVLAQVAKARDTKLTKQ